jgi:uncharacterized protein
MRYLIDVGHPAHVHNYRNLARELEKDGHKVFLTVKNIDVAKRLLDFYGFKYIVLPKKSDTILGKVCKQLIYDLIILWICLTKRIDIAIGTSVSVAHVSKISGVRSIVFDDDDDDVQPLVTKYVNPYASAILSPEALRGHRKRADTIFYKGYHELAYLHPKRFIPDPSVLTELGIRKDEIFFLMRFNVFKAHHDTGIDGLSLDQKLKLIEILKPHGRIFITTERDIEPELKSLQLKVSPEKIHSLIYYSAMFLGDSQTMTTEAAVLGTPALKCNSFAGRLAGPNELEIKYGLCYSFLPRQFDLMVLKLVELLGRKDRKKEWHSRREIMLKDMIDVTAFWTWFVSNYPISNDTVMKDPGYQLNFR